MKNVFGRTMYRIRRQRKKQYKAKQKKKSKTIEIYKFAEFLVIPFFTALISLLAMAHPLLRSPPIVIYYYILFSL